MNDEQLARTAAEVAGQLLTEIRNSKLFEGTALGQAGDHVANAFLMKAIREHRPDDGILSEEEADNADRLGRERVWIIDPLDGTREYSEGRNDWAVHVALSVDGKAAIGAVALPGLSRTLCTDDAAVAPKGAGNPRMVVSRTRPAAETDVVAKTLGAELIAMGSAGAKAMAVVRGEADIYLHSGGQFEWDSCAPAAVALAAGLHVTRLDGSPLEYNRPNPSLPDLIICRPEWAPRVLACVADACEQTD